VLPEVPPGQVGTEDIGGGQPGGFVPAGDLASDELEARAMEFDLWSNPFFDWVTHRALM